MVSITNGRVLFERVKKDEDYGINRKAAVDLSFTIEEGSAPEPAIDLVGQLARRKVEEFLGAKPASVAAPVVTNAGGDKAALAAAAQAAAQPVEETKKRAGRPPNPAKKIEPPAASEPAKVETKPADEWEAEAPKPAAEITDKDLTDACAKKNAETKNPTAIRAIISKFGQSTHMIPQDKRSEFLKELAGVPKAA
jgi:hypothetical protein